MKLIWEMCINMRTIKQEWNQKWVSEIKGAWNELKNKKTWYRQIPNLLTASRLFSPFIIIPIAFLTDPFTTFIVTAVFALTDAFDGAIARKFHLESKLGAMLDPVTDKVFAFSLLFPNVTKFPIIIGIFLFLEVIIAFINSYSTLKDNHPKSNLLGKTKTTFLSISAIAMYLSNITIIQTMIPILIMLTIFLQLSSAICYKQIDRKKDQEKKIQPLY